MALVYGGSGVNPTLRGQPTITVGLQAGETAIIPAGTWFLRPGKYCKLQQYDPVQGIWFGLGDDSNADRFISSDGNNWRVANQTGCVVGALITNAGSAYTSAPLLTAGSGNAVFTTIVGGAVNTSVTVTNGGNNYTYPPQVLLTTPGNPGIQASGFASLTSGAVSSVTILDQGAGYASAPTVTFINDPRDVTGYGASATTTLTGAQTVTGVLVTNHGTPLTSVPTLTPSGGGGSSFAATAIMDFTLTAVTVSSGASGSGYAGNVAILGLDNFPTTAPAYTNPTTQKALVKTRPAFVNVTASGTISTSTAAQVVVDGGIFSSVPLLIVLASTPPVTAATVSAVVGGVSDVYQLIAA